MARLGFPLAQGIGGDIAYGILARSLGTLTGSGTGASAVTGADAGILGAITAVATGTVISRGVSGGVVWDYVEDALWRWVVRGSGLSGDHVIWDQQFAPRPQEPMISMRIQIADDPAQPWLDQRPNYLLIDTLTAVSVNASTDTLGATNHGLSSGDGPVRVASTGSLPGGLAVDTDYWVIRTGASTLQLASTFTRSGAGGAGNAITPIDITSAGTGTLSITGTSESQRAGEEMMYTSRGLINITLQLQCATTEGVGMSKALSVLRRIVSRSALPGQYEILRGANIGLKQAQKVRAIHGVTGAVLFEPRAVLEVHLLLASEESEYGAIITHVTGTNLIDNTVINEGIL